MYVAYLDEFGHIGPFVSKVRVFFTSTYTALYLRGNRDNQTSLASTSKEPEAPNLGHLGYHDQRNQHHRAGCELKTSVREQHRS